MVLANNDFVEINYTGKLAEDHIIFDTTDKETAKKNGIYDAKRVYDSPIVCIGAGAVVRGLDEALVGKNEGDAFTITLKPEDAFGKKDAKLIRLIPTSKFTKQKINPVPGMPVHIDNTMGVVKTVGAGRVFVDFNHQLAGKEVIYDVSLGKKVTDTKKKVDSILEPTFKGLKTSFSDEKLTIETQMEFPAPYQELIEKQIKKYIPEVTSVTFTVGKEQK